jgi:hypothetical protein
MPDRSEGSSKRFGYFALCVVVIASRLAYVVHDRTYANVLGGAEAERAAANLAREGSIGNVYSDRSGPSAHVAPLYPVFLAGIYRAFGWDTQLGRLVQECMAILATTAGIALLPAVARATRLTVPAGWTAAITLAVLPLNLWIESSGSWEQPYAAVLLLGAVIMFCRLDQQRWTVRNTAIACGTLTGLAALLSPAMLPGFALMALVALLRHRHERQVWPRALLLITVSAIIISPWVVRNFVVLHAFIPMRSNMGLELAIGNHDGANGQTFGTSFRDPNSPMYRMHPLTSVAERRRVEEKGEPAYMHEKLAVATEWISSHPAQFAALTARRFRLFWFPPPTLWSPGSPGAALKAAVSISTALFAFCGLTWHVLRRHEHAWILVSALIGPSLLYVITHIDPRLRYAVFGLTTLVCADAGHRLLRVAASRWWSERGPSEGGGSRGRGMAIGR